MSNVEKENLIHPSTTRLPDTPTALVPQSETPVAIVQSGAIDVAAAIREISRSADPDKSVNALKELIGMAERQQDRQATRDFWQAFARVRARTQTIEATHANPDKNSDARWWMALLRELQDAVEPILRSEGMEYTLNPPRDEKSPNHIRGEFILIHIPTGHRNTWECWVNAANAMGGDIGAATMAKRGAMIAGLALKIAHTDNARIEGSFCTAAEVSEIKRRFYALKWQGSQEDQVKRFLKFAKAIAWQEIRQGMLGQVRNWLDSQEKKQGIKPAPMSPESEAVKF